MQLAHVGSRAKVAWLFVDYSIVIGAVFAIALAIGVATVGTYQARALVLPAPVRQVATAAGVVALSPRAPTGVTGSDRLSLIVGGRSQPFENGGTASLGGNLLGQIQVASTSVQRYQRNVDIFVVTDNASVQAVDGLTIRGAVRSLTMDMGTLPQAAVPLGNGHYLLPLEFSMPGQWQIDLTVGRGQGQPSSVTLDLDFRN